jgi:hypothetical protein
MRMLYFTMTRNNLILIAAALFSGRMIRQPRFLALHNHQAKQSIPENE